VVYTVQLSKGMPHKNHRRFTGDDLTVYVVDMEHHETAVRRLTDNQLQEAYGNGMDMFYLLCP